MDIRFRRSYKPLGSMKGRCEVGGIEPFDISRIDHAFTLGGSNDLFDHGLLTLNDDPLDIQDISLLGFDDLNDRDIGPFHQSHTPRLTFGTRNAGSKGVPKHRQIGIQSVNRDQ